MPAPVEETIPAPESISYTLVIEGHTLPYSPINSVYAIVYGPMFCSLASSVANPPRYHRLMSANTMNTAIKINRFLKKDFRNLIF